MMMRRVIPQQQQPRPAAVAIPSQAVVQQQQRHLANTSPVATSAVAEIDLTDEDERPQLANNTQMKLSVRTPAAVNQTFQMGGTQVRTNIVQITKGATTTSPRKFSPLPCVMHFI